MRHLLPFFALLLVASPALAVTAEIAPNVYQVTEGVAFELENVGASDFLFNWTDSNGTFTDVVDPTLVLTIGQTYTFQRLTPAHPFVITDDTLPVSGTDGFFNRSTFDGAVIDAATLTPIADFTADPGPTTDLISWTPNMIADYFYTCRVTSHPGMTGAIRTTDSAVSNDEGSFGAVKALFGN